MNTFLCFWRSRQWCVFPVLQAGREDVLSHCCNRSELHRALGLHGGSVRHRAAEGTHTHTHTVWMFSVSWFTNICTGNLFFLMVFTIWWQSNEMPDTHKHTQTHSIIESQDSSSSEPICHPLWFSTAVSDTHTDIDVWKSSRISDDPLIQPSLSGSRWAERWRRWRSEAVISIGQTVDVHKSQWTGPGLL